MILTITMTREEIQNEIPYALICETRYGSKWNTMKRKRAWLKEFSAEEREKCYRLFNLSNTWHLVKGVPENVTMSLSTKMLWDKLACFCYSI